MSDTRAPDPAVLADLGRLPRARRQRRGGAGKLAPATEPTAPALGRKVDRHPRHAAIQAAAEAGVPVSGVTGKRSLEKKLVAMMETILRGGQPAIVALSLAGD